MLTLQMNLHRSGLTLLFSIYKTYFWNWFEARLPFQPDSLLCDMCMCTHTSLHSYWPQRRNGIKNVQRLRTQKMTPVHRNLSVIICLLQVQLSSFFEKSASLIQSRTLGDYFKKVYIYINLLLFLPPHPHPFWFVRSPCNSLFPILRLAGSRSVYVCVCVEGWWGRGGGVVTTSTMGLAGPVLGFAWAEGGLLCLVGLPACLSKNYWSVTSYFNTPWWLCLYHKYVMGFSLASLLVYILIWGQKSDIISVQTHRLSDIIPSDCCQVLFCSLHIVCMCHNK